MKCRAAVRAVRAAGPGLALAQKRPLATDDVYNVKDVRDPQRSPDGKWVAYTVSRAIKDTDKNDTDIWMVSWDGTQEHPAHLVARRRVAAALEPRQQVPLVRLVAAGGEGRPGLAAQPRRRRSVKVSDVKGGVSDYAWSPDSKRLVLVVSEPDPREPKDDDKDGRPTRRRRRRRSSSTATTSSRTSRATCAASATHLYLFDVATKKAEALTPGTLYDEAVAGVVARRHADRLRQQARRRRRRPARRTPTSA